MNKQRILILILSLAGMAGTFLPWVSNRFDGSSISGTVGDGWITFILYGLVLIFTLITRDFQSVLKTGMKVTVIVISLLASLFGIWKYTEFQDVINENSVPLFGTSLFKIESGVYVISVAGFLIILAALLIRSKKEEMKNL